MLFYAVIAAGVVVAFADGQAAPEERSTVVDVVERSGWLSTYTSTEAGDAFDSQVRQLELEGGVPETVLECVRRVGDGAGSRVVIGAAEQVAIADGHLRPSEQRALGLIRSALTSSSKPGPS